MPGLSLRASEGSEAISSFTFGDCFVASLLAMTFGDGVRVGVRGGVFVGVDMGVGDGVGVAVGVGVGGGVGVAVGVGVGEGVGVAVGMGVGDGVSVGRGVGVAVGEGVAVLVGVAVGVEVGWREPRAEDGPSSTNRRGLPPMKQLMGSLQSAPARVRTY